MTATLPDPLTRDGLLVWCLHRIAEKFGDHAILKGGMSLRLLDSPRLTNDLDFVFVPYRSKKEILPGLKKIADNVPGAVVAVALHSKNLTLRITVGKVAVQIEANVGQSCQSRPIATTFLARQVHEQARIIRIMDFGTALAHKLAAWNERRLVRDLYDVYFLYKIVDARLEVGILKDRLSHIDSRLPAFKKRKKMSMNDFWMEIAEEAKKLTPAKVARELSSLLPADDLAGLDVKIRTAINELSEKINLR